MLRYGWLDYDGNPRPEDAPRLIECECFEPMLPEEIADREFERALQERRGLVDGSEE